MPQQQNTEINIISIDLHQIDLNRNSLRHIQIQDTNTNLQRYLDGILNEVNRKNQKREFEFEGTSSAFYNIMLSYFQEQDIGTNHSSNELSNRLLIKEIDTDTRYGHLVRNELEGIVKRGSFLQFLYRLDNCTFYLAVKIEHEEFLDENDFQSKIGLAYTKKIYKACRVAFDSSGIPGDVFVYDTNKSIAKYWWFDFLELKEKITDAKNTELASKSVIAQLSLIKDDHPKDYTILRNASVAAFKQNAQMDYLNFVESLFTTYQPQDEALVPKMPNLVSKMRELPNVKKFDTLFNLVPGSVPFKKVKFSLRPDISISYDEDIKDINNKIWAEETAEGKKLVVIDSPDGFSKFTLKSRL